MTEPARTSHPNPGSPNTSGPLIDLATLRDRWGWFLVLGIILLVAGGIAAYHVVTATVVSVIFVGALMLVGGVSQLVHAWRVKNWPGFLLWTVSGVLYIGAGLLALFNPLAGAAALTLLLGAILIGSGALRLWIWFNNRSQKGWPWLAASGLISVIVGLLIAFGWPDNSIWILGLLLAIDLIFQGWMLILLGLALRQRG